MAVESTQLGNVYVFNATPYDIVNPTLNQEPISASLNAIDVKTGYAASSDVVARNSSPGNPGNNTFGGENSLEIYYQGGGSVTVPVNISQHEAPLSKDLQLYIFHNQVTLVLPDGSPKIFSATAKG